MTNNEACNPPRAKVVLYIVSFLFSLVGIIMGIVYMVKPGKECKKFGRLCLILGTVSIVVGLLISLVAGVLVFNKINKEINETPDEFYEEIKNIDWGDYTIEEDDLDDSSLSDDEGLDEVLDSENSSIIDAYMTNDLTETNAPDAELSSYAADMDTFYASAELSVDTTEDRPFTAKWYVNNIQVYSDAIGSFNPSYYSKHIASVMTLTDYDESLSLWPTGDYKVEWYEDEALVKTVNFKVMAQ